MSYRVVLVNVASGEVMGQTSAVESKMDAEISCRRNNAMLKNLALEYRVREEFELPVPKVRDAMTVLNECKVSHRGRHQRGGAGVCIHCGDGG